MSCFSSAAFEIGHPASKVTDKYVSRWVPRLVGLPVDCIWERPELNYRVISDSPRVKMNMCLTGSLGWQKSLEELELSYRAISEAAVRQSLVGLPLGALRLAMKSWSWFPGHFRIHGWDQGCGPITWDTGRHRQTPPRSLGVWCWWLDQGHTRMYLSPQGDGTVSMSVTMVACQPPGHSLHSQNGPPRSETPLGFHSPLLGSQGSHKGTFVHGWLPNYCCWVGNTSRERPTPSFSDITLLEYVFFKTIKTRQ